MARDGGEYVGDGDHAFAKRPAGDRETHEVRETLDREILQMQIDADGRELVEDFADSLAGAEGVGGVQADADAIARDGVHEATQCGARKTVVILDPEREVRGSQWGEG